jgi:hypothetical protein
MTTTEQPTTWTEDDARDAYWDRRQALLEALLDDQPAPQPPASNDEQLTLELGA